MRKTIRELMNQYPDKEFHLYDGMGVFGELPIDNLDHKPDSYVVGKDIVKMFVS